MFSLLLLLIWTWGAQSSAPMWVSVSISISIHPQMKVLWCYARYSSVWLWDKASSGTLSSAAQGTIWGPLLGPGNPSRDKSLENPEMVPLIKIFTFLLPYPPVLHPTHPTPPSSPESSPSPFSLPISPYINHSPHPHAHSFCPAILFASNFQEDLYMFFFGFTLLFGFSGLVNYGLNDLGLWLEFTNE